MNSIENFFEKIGLTGTIVGSAVLLFFGWLLGKKKQSAETRKLTTEEIITREQYNKEAYKEIVAELEEVKKERDLLKEAVKKQDIRIDQLTRKMNMMDAFKSIDK